MRVPPIRSSRLLRLACLAAVGAAATTGAAVSPAAAATSRFTEVPTGITNAAMTDITTAPDGVSWITSAGKGSLFKVQSDGRVQERPMSSSAGRRRPSQIAVDASGTIWTTEPGTTSLLRTDADGGLTTDVATGAGEPTDVATGGDGSVWFVTASGNTLGRVTPGGDVTRFTVGHQPARLATAVGGAVWFTTTDGYAGLTQADGTTEFMFVGAGLTDLTADPAGHAWLSTAGSILRLTPQGQVSTFTTGITAGGAIDDVEAGKQGLIWYSDPVTRTIGRVTAAGAITAYPTLNAAAPGGRGAAPRGLTLDASSNPIYFGTSEEGLIADVVGLVSPADLPTGTLGGATEITTSKATLAATVNPEGAGATVIFEYGTSARFGQSSASVALPGDIVPLEVSAPIGDLEPRRTYWYRVVASNARGTWTSPALQFTTTNVPLPTNPLAPMTPKGSSTPTPSITPSTVDGVPAQQLLTVAAKAARLSAKGVMKLRISCGPAAPCAAEVSVTAKVRVKGKAKTVVIAKKPVRLVAGTTTDLGLRVSAAGQSAVRRAGRKGLSSLAVVTVGETKTRARLTLKA